MSFTVIPPAPTITSFNPTSGVSGDAIAITGTNLTGATSVFFNGVSASFIVNSATQITATIPTGCSSGLIEVASPGGTVKSYSGFTVNSSGGSGNGGASNLTETTITISTPSINASATHLTLVNLGKSFILTKIQSSAPVRIRVFSTSSYRDLDLSREIGTTVENYYSSSGEHGVISDNNLTNGNLTLDLGRPAIGSSRETPRSSDCPIAITNTDNVSRVITVTFTALILEQ